jgi:hypothetical protein
MNQIVPSNETAPNSQVKQQNPVIIADNVRRDLIYQYRAAEAERCWFFDS